MKKAIRLFVIAASICSCLSCADNLDDIDFSEYFSYSGDWNWNFQESGSLTKGSYYQGGIVFYVDSTGQHGLIASVEDQGAGTAWWNGEFVKTNASSPSDGKDNTMLILDAQGTAAPYAAKLCAEYQIDGYDDWFLPSKDELDLLFENRFLFHNMETELYWSSTEYEIGSVWVQDFSSGEQHLDSSSDSAGVRTRAIRAF